MKSPTVKIDEKELKAMLNIIEAPLSEAICPLWNVKMLKSVEYAYLV